MSADITRISKFLSLILRHAPEKIGLELDSAGWVEVDHLVAACERHGQPLTRETLAIIVQESDKQRFSFSSDNCKIRANQGHSIPIELGYEEKVPPALLFHGTAARFLNAIKEEGLRKKQRNHVHLTTSAETAMAVGERYGEPVLLKIDAAGMHRDGHIFFLTVNSVWLTKSVPPNFISF